MNTVEQIRNYVERTRVKDSYGMKFREAQALYYMAKENPVDAVFLAFEFGEAKRERYNRRRAERGEKPV